jgi:fermentation-respiration switch protein FrsA (DUF1100 family)
MTVLRSYKPLRYVLPGIGALLAGMIGAAAYTAYYLSGRQRRIVNEYMFSPWEVQVEHEQISFVTEDGVTIRGWWFARPETSRVIIGCAGHRGNKTDLLGIGSGLWRAGNNVLLFDYRGCGESDHASQSLAHHELRDARAAIRYAQQRVTDAEIGLLGYSMGGAVVIQVAAADPSIRVVVADSSFATMRDVVAAGIRRRRLPTRPVLDLTDALTGLRYGYRFHAVRPLDVVGQIAPRPLLLIHGGADAITPVIHARWLYEAAGEPKELWILEDVPHCGGYFVDRPEYVRRVAEFFARAFAAAE